MQLSMLIKYSNHL